MSEKERHPKSRHPERVRADDAVATAHTRGLLITFNHDDDQHLQVVVSKDQALALARDILNVIYNMGIKVD